MDHQAGTSKYPIVGRQLAQAKNPIVDHLVAQTNSQLDTKQEIQWISKANPRDLPRSVGRPV